MIEFVIFYTERISKYLLVILRSKELENSGLLCDWVFTKERLFNSGE
jgi:hypothetical protein